MAFSHSPKIVTDGLVLYLDAANPKSYPGSGTTWKDLSGQGNNGTLVNNPSLNGGFVDFSGTNDYVSTNFTQNYSTVSFCAWVKNEANSQGGIITKGPVNGIEYGISFGYSNPVLLVCRHNGSSGQITVQWQNSYYQNGWHYICLTVGEGLKKLYIDANLVSQNSGNLGSPIESFQIGFHGSSYYFNGKLSQPQIYNRVLTASEVLQNYNALKGRFGL